MQQSEIPENTLSASFHPGFRYASSGLRLLATLVSSKYDFISSK
jgi:hypothetical protein